MSYYVICRTDQRADIGEGGIEYVMGKYALTTSRSFDDFAAAERYASGVAPTREPKILMEVFAMQPEVWSVGNPGFEMECVAEDEDV